MHVDDSYVADVCAFEDCQTILAIVHFYVGRSKTEWNLKMKIEILVCTAIMLKNRSNPYIESANSLIIIDVKNKELFLHSPTITAKGSLNEKHLKRA